MTPVGARSGTDAWASLDFLATPRNLYLLVRWYQSFYHFISLAGVRENESIDVQDRNAGSRHLWSILTTIAPDLMLGAS